jgi:hypothetical protein
MDNLIGFTFDQIVGRVWGTMEEIGRNYGE